MPEDVVITKADVIVIGESALVQLVVGWDGATPHAAGKWQVARCIMSVDLQPAVNTN